MKQLEDLENKFKDALILKCPSTGKLFINPLKKSKRERPLINLTLRTVLLRNEGVYLEYMGKAAEIIAEFKEGFPRYKCRIEVCDETNLIKHAGQNWNVTEFAEFFLKLNEVDRYLFLNEIEIEDARFKESQKECEKNILEAHGICFRNWAELGEPMITTVEIKEESDIFTKIWLGLAEETKKAVRIANLRRQLKEIGGEEFLKAWKVTQHDVNAVQGCGTKDSILSGLYPSDKKIISWCKKLIENGINYGVECRLVAGAEKGKIVKFENIGFNDLGITSGDHMGYFFNIFEGEKEPKAAKPIFKRISHLEAKKNIFGRQTFGVILKHPRGKGEKGLLTIDNEKIYILENESVKEGVFETVGVLRDLDIEVKSIYDFESVKDLFGWLSI